MTDGRVVTSHTRSVSAAQKAVGGPSGAPPPWPQARSGGVLPWGCAPCTPRPSPWIQSHRKNGVGAEQKQEDLGPRPKVPAPAVSAHVCGFASSLHAGLCSAVSPAPGAPGPLRAVFLRRPVATDVARLCCTLAAAPTRPCALRCLEHAVSAFVERPMGAP